ncbi:MAG: threonine/serine exporter family protein [Clostridia bacterium]|nr:threonine/serine exporter family protein [Clostridia bacterium]
MISREMIQIFTGFLGSFGFAIMFNIRGKKLAAAAFGGFISWTLFLLLGFVTESEPIRYFIVSVLISAYSEIMARILKTPTTTFIITSLIALIPGGSLYYTMSNAFRSDLSSFINNGIHTIQLAVALALGVVAVTAFTKLLYRFLGIKRH